MSVLACVCAHRQIKMYQCHEQQPAGMHEHPASFSVGNSDVAQVAIAILVHTELAICRAYQQGCPVVSGQVEMGLVAKPKGQFCFVHHVNKVLIFRQELDGAANVVWMSMSICRTGGTHAINQFARQSCCT